MNLLLCLILRKMLFIVLDQSLNLFLKLFVGYVIQHMLSLLSWSLILLVASRLLNTRLKLSHGLTILLGACRNILILITHLNCLIIHTSRDGSLNIVLSHGLSRVLMCLVIYMASLRYLYRIILAWGQRVTSCVGRCRILMVELDRVRICSCRSTLVLQLVLLIWNSLFQRFALLVIQLTVTITRHAWTNMLLMTSLVFLSCRHVVAIVLITIRAWSCMMCLRTILKMVDLLILGVRRTHSLFSVPDTFMVITCFLIGTLRSSHLESLGLLLSLSLRNAELQ